MNVDARNVRRKGPERYGPGPRHSDVAPIFAERARDHPLRLQVPRGDGTDRNMTKTEQCEALERLGEFVWP